MQKSTLPNLMPAEFAAMGKKRLEEFTKAQTELLNKVEETNRKWFERMQSEANLRFRVYFEIDGGAIDPGRDDGVSGMDQPSV